MEHEKITIVEGPTPSFEFALNSWTLGMTEGPHLPHTVRTTLRTLNGQTLLDRCQSAWHTNRDTFLEYRDKDGFSREAIIVAARTEMLDDGEVIHLWLRLDELPEDEFDDDDLIDLD